MATRIGIYVDVSNLFFCIRKHFSGRKLHYKRLLEQAGLLGEVVSAVAYGAQRGREADTFIYTIQQMDWIAKFKKVKQWQNTIEGGPRRKADWDIGITIDIVDAVLNDTVDTVILGSADGDFAPLVTWLKNRDIRIIIMACNISRDLRDQTTCLEIVESMLEDESDER